MDQRVRFTEHRYRQLRCAWCRRHARFTLHTAVFQLAFVGGDEVEWQLHVCADHREHALSVHRAYLDELGLPAVVGLA